MSNAPLVPLNNGVAMPQLGFGVWRIAAGQTAEAVDLALAAGYRSIDTASLYGNEEGVGQAVAASGVPREELFVTTKLWNSHRTTWTRDAVLREFDAQLARLGMEYVDLYLLHWPRPMRDDYLTILRTFGEIESGGRARAVGVSNFQPDHLRRVIDETGLVPAVNQVELHPHLQQPELRAFHAEHGIVTEAWGPLGQGKGLLGDERIAKIAARHGRSPAQAVLRWHVQLGVVAIPKSVTPSRIRENLDVFDFELDDEDLATFAALDQGRRLGGHPDTFDPA